MNYYTKYPDVQTLSEHDGLVKAYRLCPCDVCHTDTHWKDFLMNAFVCSEECRASLERESNP